MNDTKRTKIFGEKVTFDKVKAVVNVAIVPNPVLQVKMVVMILQV